MKNKKYIPDLEYLATLHKHNKPRTFILEPIDTSLILSNLKVSNYRKAEVKNILK